MQETVTQLSRMKELIAPTRGEQEQHAYSNAIKQQYKDGEPSLTYQRSEAFESLNIIIKSELERLKNDNLSLTDFSFCTLDEASFPYKDSIKVTINKLKTTDDIKNYCKFHGVEFDFNNI